jgi:hypothetical protein
VCHPPSPSITPQPPLLPPLLNQLLSAPQQRTETLLLLPLWLLL